MKKLLSIVLILAMISTILMSCKSDAKQGGSSPQGTGTSTGTGTENKTLQVIWFSDGSEGASMRKLADKYEAENPGIKIELIETPFTEVDTKIKNMLSANQPPALARLADIGMFKNKLIDQTQYASTGVDFAKNFSPALKVLWDGKMIGAPMDVTVNGMIYNKTAFEKAGVAVPLSPEEVWTWAEWKEAMQKVMANGGVKYGSVLDRTPFRFSTMIYEAGGSMLNSDMTASNFNTKEVINAVTFFKQLHDEGIMPDSVWVGGENPNNLFRTGQVATHFGGSWLISNYKTEITDFEWGVTYLPKEMSRSTVPGGKYLAAFDGSGVEAEAVAFIEWLSKPENNAQYCIENNFMSPVVGNEKLEYEYGQEFFEIFSNELEATSSTPASEWGYQEFTSQIKNEIRDELVEVLTGTITPEEYAEKLDGLFTKALSEIA